MQTKSGFESVKIFEFWKKNVGKVLILQSDQNMMIPELSGIHVNSSFEVSSYFGQAVIRASKANDIKKDAIWTRYIL